MDNGFLGGAAVEAMLTPGAGLYFAGICGISMAGLARIAKGRGFSVRGCDRDAENETARLLRAAGIPVEPERDADVRGSSLLVYSAAIQADSPAVAGAAAAGIPCVSRADFLAALMRPYPNRIAVAGMHGKSTTVGMLTAILEQAGLDPTVSAGAPLVPGGNAWREGGKQYFICEACEYRDSFLSLAPTLSVVTNIELDHPDYFPNLAAVQSSFAAFLKRSGAAVIGGDCPPLCDIAGSDSLRFGFGEGCGVRGERIAENPAAMTIWRDGERLGEVRLPLPGDYNRENALAATAAALCIGIPFSVIAPALAEFRGVGRRMEYIGEYGGAAVYLDYAHHPTEMVAAITAARERGGRVLCVYQPHTYTRTRALWEAFIQALRLPDFTLLLDAYAAREAVIPGYTSSELAQAAGVGYAPDMPTAAERIKAELHPKDTLLIMGAGDIVKLTAYLFM